MVNNILSIILAVLVALICLVHSEETAHETGLQSSDEIHVAHLQQKRNAISNPIAEENEILLTSDGGADSSIPEDAFNKRGSLFRFGKRQGNLFRFGKRGSLLRFGKRQGGTLFRFGKRGGSLFRFGRSGNAAENSMEGPKDDKRTLFRFGKRSESDLLRQAIAQYELENSQALADGEESKRGVDSFHWGSDSEK